MSKGKNMMTEHSDTVLSNEGELHLSPGGPMFRLMQRIGVARQGHPSIWRRIIGLVLITWVPMCLLALLQGAAIGPTPRESFLLDFGSYARFFVGLPILIMAEGLIGPRLTQAGRQFIRDGLVRPADYPAFEQAIARLARRRESVPATLVIVALAAFGAWKLTLETVSGVGLGSWQSVLLPEGHAFRYSLAALWNQLVAVPVVLFLLYRWLWRVLIWTLFLRDVARMNLELVPTHADRAGGLGFLEIAHASFGSLAFAVARVLSAVAAFRIVFEGARLDSFQVPFIGLLVVMEILFLGPLLVFCPAMARARRAALRTYGSLVVRYNRGFQRKWFEDPGPRDEQLLGSADIQSLADLGNSFRFVHDMRLMPFGRWSVIGLALITALPALPLLLLVMPISEILGALARVAF